MLKAFYDQLNEDKEDEMDTENLNEKTNILDDKGKDLMVCKILEATFGKTDKVIGKNILLNQNRLQ